MGLGSTFKIADPDQWNNAQIGPDPDPTDQIGTSLINISNTDVFFAQC